MRILYPFAKLQDYMMRNPTTVEFHGDFTGVAPHALTSRWSQSTPAGKYWVIETIMVAVRREAAATPVGLVTARVKISEGGRLTYVIDWRFSDNTVNYYHFEIAPGLIHLVPLTSLTFETADLGTGGSCEYIVSGHLFEYEA